MVKLVSPLHGSVSQDFVEMIADMKMIDDEGRDLPLRKSCGKVDIDLVLYILGFKWDYKRNEAVYDMLTENVKYHVRDSSDSVFVRNNKNPYQVRRMQVYTGYIRENSPYRSLYKDNIILTGDFTHGGDLRIINDEDKGIGTSDDYNGKKYTAHHYRDPTDTINTEQDNY